MISWSLRLSCFVVGKKQVLAQNFTLGSSWHIPVTKNPLAYINYSQPLH